MGSLAYCVGLLLEGVGFLCVYCAASGGFALVSSNMTLVLLRTIVRVKRRVGTIIFLSGKVGARLPECGAVVKIARLEQSTMKKSFKLHADE